MFTGGAGIGYGQGMDNAITDYEKTRIRGIVRMFLAGRTTITPRAARMHWGFVRRDYGNRPAVYGFWLGCIRGEG